MVKEGLKYVLPLRRNDAKIDYQAFKTFDYNAFDGFFIFKRRCIWYKTYTSLVYRRLACFYDGKLAEEERQDYMARVNREAEGYSIEGFHAKQHHFGTITLATNLPVNVNANSVYLYFKSSIEVEQLFDTFKNTLEGDKTYMRGSKEMETWLLINPIS
ncbi:MAG: hypothetical protein AAF380_00755 [Bacteroidota bacterium]